MTTLSYGFCLSTLGHAYSSVRTSPSSNITQRLNSIDALFVHTTTEENIEDSISVQNFGKLIHATPFKASMKIKKASSIKVPQKSPTTPKNPSNTKNFTAHVRPKLFRRDSDQTNENNALMRSNTVVSPSNTSTDKGSTRGILKKGNRSRFAQRSRVYTDQGSSEASLSRVTIMD